MTYINPINVNSQGVSGSYGFGAKPQTKSDESAAEETPATAQTQQTQVSADQVLNYMAQSAVSVTPKTVDPSKYVDSESAQRIAGFMSQFEDIVATNLTAINAEFPDMSDSSKQAMALAQVDKQSA